MKRWLKPVLSALVVVVFGAAAGAGIILTKAHFGPVPEAIVGDYSSYRMAVNADVLLLGTTSCEYCIRTRELLHGRGVRFADLDLLQSEQARRIHHELGARSVPVLLVGDYQIRGFRPEQIDAALHDWNSAGGSATQ